MNRVARLPDVPIVARSWIDRFDPRLRIAALPTAAIVIVLSTKPAVWWLMLAAALLAAASLGLSPRTLLARLIPVNVVVIASAVLVPWTAGLGSGSGPVGFDLTAWDVVVEIAVKSNAVVLWMCGLVGTMEIPTLGHALIHLRVPRKLVHLLLFTVRYLHVMHDEYRRLHTAMLIRGFRPRCDRRTFRAYGNMVGMLLVRSMARCERIMAAMRCRGFRGQFHVWRHFHFSAWDGVFLLGAAALFAACGVLEWMS
ncbi:MAG: cobalt ECF transporter T component CbiQ [Thermogutta sp.]|nr:cobalt ECF transporter T component CbiQ [Thermogutta sp.]